MVIFKNRKRSINQRNYRKNKKKKTYSVDYYRRWRDYRNSEDYIIKRKSAQPAKKTTQRTPIKKRSQYEWRYVIDFVYDQILGSPPPDEWSSKGGTVSQIISLLGMNKGSRNVVYSVLRKSIKAEFSGMGREWDKNRTRMG